MRRIWILGALLGAATLSVSAAEAAPAPKNPWPQRLELNGPAGSAFGYATAISGGTMAVDEPYESNNNGAVAIFMRMGSGWSQQTVIDPPATTTPGADDHGFGQSLAFLNGNTLVVGSPYESDYAGAVYVYVKSGQTWTLFQTITDPNATAYDYFGEALAIKGPQFLTAGDQSSTGAVYAYQQMGANKPWTQQQTITPSDGATYDEFAFAIAVDGDNLVVGSPGHNGGNGAAYVYKQAGKTWTAQAEVQDPGNNSSDNFGISVAIDGPTIVVGAPDNGAGTAYVFTQAGPNWKQQAQLNPSDGASGDQFGWPVAVNGNTIAVAGSNHTTSTGGSGAGAVYAYTQHGMAWPQTAELIPTDSYGGSFFGWPTLMFDGPDLVISAPYTPTGSLYWFGS